MPMDPRTKQTVRALLDRYPSGYATEEAGFTVTDSPTGIFRLLCLGILADDSTPSEGAMAGMRAMLRRGFDAVAPLAEADEREVGDALARAGHPDPEYGARNLCAAARLVRDRWNGDVNAIHREDGGDARKLDALLGEIPGMDEAGRAVFLREAQIFWPEAGPFLDAHAARAARRLGLPDRADTLLTDVARGEREEELSWLVGALALVDAHDEYGEIEAAVR
ncbi:endonuclease [Actinomadura rayongensis]|uniref:Endonuclease n=1 Tax=Actinomadura rayongensis TaxID=1429076 RepID=A0A6I4W3S3_9ACTN|nr:endonuclease [Actinomadura rayongensis]MXQ63360.1 endonuclease [Actinomadura rayongensis]